MASPYPSSNVDDDLDKPPNTAARIEIWEKLFDRPSDQGPPKAALEKAAEPYFAHLYGDEQLRLDRGLRDETRQAGKLAVKRHKDVFELAHILEKNKDKSLSDIMTDLKSKPKYNAFSDEQITHSIDLTIRLAFLVNARHGEGQGSDPRAPTLKWEAHQTLRKFMRDIFPPSAWAPQGKESLTRLNICFTASYMVEVCGLRLEYTASLQEHLRLHRSEKHTVLRVFPYKACLNALESNSSDPVIPKDVLREAIKTLNLLFPMWDPGTETLLMEQQQRSDSMLKNLWEDNEA